MLRHYCYGFRFIMRWILVVGFIVCFLNGCATTATGRGIDLVEDYKDAQAIPFLEQGVEAGSKTAALILAFIYLSDFQVPINVDKATHYYDVFQALNPNYYDQYLDYYIPQVQARILLEDDNPSNDSQATKLLRLTNYSRYSPSLRLLAKCYSFGTGVKKNYSIAHQLFERSIEYERNQYGRLDYIWWLAVHPDKDFRDELKALRIMNSLDEFDDEILVVAYDNYAAVYAANGRFDKAVEFQKKALSRLEKDINIYPAYSKWLEDYQARLVSYNKQQAWTEE